MVNVALGKLRQNLRGKGNKDHMPFEPVSEVVKSFSDTTAPKPESARE